MNMKLSFDEQSKREVTARFTQDIAEMAACIAGLFDEMHDWASEEGYHQYIAAYEKFRTIHSEEMKNGTMKIFQSWKQSDASITTLLKEMKAVPEDRIKSLAAEFESPLEEALRDVFKNEPEPLTEADAVHLTRTLEEDNEVLQEMLDCCFDELDELLYDAKDQYESLAFENQLYACVGALVKSILSIASGLYDRFAKAAEELGLHLNDRADRTESRAADASNSLQHSSEEFVSLLDRLIGLIED